MSPTESTFASDALTGDVHCDGDGDMHLRHGHTDLHSCSSRISSPPPPEEWSIGSPALSITSIDPSSPSLRFKGRSSNGTRFENSRSSVCEREEEEYAEERAADLRQKASNYLQYVESLSQAYESQLKYLSAFFKEYAYESHSSLDDLERYTDDPPVTIIEVDGNGSRHLIGIDNVATLVEYFCERENEDNLRVVSRVFLLDKITPDVLGIFGAKLGVEPQFWDAHLQLSSSNLTDGTTSGSAGGQFVKYGSDTGSRVSFLNIPLLRRHPSSESLDRLQETSKETTKKEELCEGCSIHLDYSADSTEPTTVLIMTNTPDGVSQLRHKSLRTSFIEHLMSHPRTEEPSTTLPVPNLTHDLIKGTVQHLTTALKTIPDHTNHQMSHFTINLFNDDTTKIRDEISSETSVISNLSRSLYNSLMAFEHVPSSSSSSSPPRRGDENVESEVADDAVELLIRAFHDQSEQIQQWLKELDATVLDHQRKRAARLRRLKIVVPMCSLSLAVGVVVVFVTKFRENY
ncbi:hypothetical protein AA313_de0205638 [Arthrobotrys entomopaga]|nr:hypothetical protein AA313_de0205638 [Arthrobotrys entomopaga]